jgi:hypothetical protein
MQKGERSVVVFMTAMFQTVISIPMIVVVSRFIYPSVLLTTSFIVTLSMLSLGIDRLLAVRVRSRSTMWEYVG